MDAVTSTALPLEGVQRDLALIRLAAVPGAPSDFGSIPEKYIPYQAHETEDWAAFTARIDAIHAEADRVWDLEAVSWNSYNTPTPDDGADQQRLQTVIETALNRARGWSSIAVESDLALSVCQRLASVGRAAGLCPRADLDPEHAVFVWASVRMLFSCLGYQRWPLVCSWFADSSAPWSSDETPEEWASAVRDAHRACGIPIQALLMHMADVRGIPELAEDGVLPRWMQWWALARVLTHVRDNGDGRLRILYRAGNTYTLATPGDSGFATNQKVLRDVPIMLGGGPLTPLFRYALNKLSMHDLFRVRPLSDVPPNILTSPAAHLYSDPSETGWSEAGLSVRHVWEARDGLVRPFHCGEDEAVEFAWALGMDDSRIMRDRHKAFLAAVPKTYDCDRMPSDILREYVPQLTNDECLPVLDAVIISAVGSDRLPANSPWPCVWCLPDDPSSEATTTNNGKTALQDILVKTFNPTHPGSSHKQDGGNEAPNARSDAARIEQYGTDSLDEFSMPHSSASLYHYANLNTLLVGGHVTMGKVRSNEAHHVMLRYPLIIGTKAVDLQPDMMSRGVFVKLRVLTDEERNRPEVYEDIRNGKAALKVRLCALAWVERHPELFEDLGGGSPSRVWKYTDISRIGQRLVAVRSGGAGSMGFDEYVAANVSSFRAWSDVVTKGGMLTLSRLGSQARFPLTDILFDLTVDQLAVLWKRSGSHTEAPHGAAAQREGLSSSDLVQALADVIGHVGDHYSLIKRWSAGALPAYLSNATITKLIGAELRKATGPDGDPAPVRMPGIPGQLGWHYQVVVGSGRPPRLFLVKSEHEETQA